MEQVSTHGRALSGKSVLALLSTIPTFCRSFLFYDGFCFLAHSSGFHYAGLFFRTGTLVSRS